MAIDRKYGKVTAERGDVAHGDGVPLNESDEPCFVIRAQDVLAVAAIRDYAHRAFHKGLADVAGGAHAAADAVADWQFANEDAVKDPD